jgi:quercetin dioxygenase-like cupin family protein
MYKTTRGAVAQESEHGALAWWLRHGGAEPSRNGVLGFADRAAGVDRPLHRHPDGEEAVIVLAGSGVATTSAGEYPLGLSSVPFAPRGAWHGLRAGAESLECLVVFAGASSVEDVGSETFDHGELTDPGPSASVRRIHDEREDSAHNPDLGFFYIRACFFVDESVGSEHLVVGEARSEAQRGLHELHRHEHGAEFFYLLEGTATHITADGEEIPFAAGDVTYTEAGEWHGMRNVGDVDTRAIFGFFGVPTRMAAGEVKR